MSEKKKGVGALAALVAVSIITFSVGVFFSYKDGTKGVYPGGLSDSGSENGSISDSAETEKNEEADSDNSTVVASTIASTSADSDLSSAKAEAEERKEDGAIPHNKDFPITFGTGLGSFASDDDDFFIIREGNRLMTNKYREVINSEEILTIENVLEGKQPERLESYKYNSYVLTIDGKSYSINEYSDGFLEYPQGAINPFILKYRDTAYIMPTSADGTIGDLYFFDCVWKDPQLVATDVVASSVGTGGMTETGNRGFYAYYTKYTDGKYSMHKVWFDDDIGTKDEKYPIEDTVISDGNCVPLYTDGSYLYYYDQDKKDLYVAYFYNKDERKKIYTGNIDEFYAFNDYSFIIRDGDKAYFYVPNNTEEMMPFNINGLEKVQNVQMWDYGYRNGHYVNQWIHSCVLEDKSGKQYYVAIDRRNEKADAVELPRKLGNQVEYYYDGWISYIEDGVLYFERNLLGDQNEKFIRFDEEKVVDYCVCHSGKYNFMILTEGGKLYAYNCDKEEDILIDTDVEMNKEGTNGQFFFDFKKGEIVYGKDGKWCVYNLEKDEKKEGKGRYGSLTRIDNIPFLHFDDLEGDYYYYGGWIYKVF